MISKKELKALDKSIEHWWQNLEMLILNYLSDECLINDIFISEGYCSLCSYILKMSQGWIDDCEDCIIVKTGHKECGGGGCWDYVHTWYCSCEPNYKTGYNTISEMLNLLIKIRNEVTKDGSQYTSSGK